jgi:hypothetical protein
MAGSIAVTSADLGGSVTKYTIAWTSDGAGAVNGTTLDLKRGRLLQVKYIPGSGGTQPTNNYVGKVLDADGVDILSNTGAALSNVAAALAAPVMGTSQILPLIDPGPVTPTITGAGAAKTGTIILFVGP